jgi:hypothetical protein
MHSQVRQIIAIYCFCDDFLQSQGHQDAPQAKLTTAEVMTIALVAATLFCGNQDRCRCFFAEHGYIKKRLSKSQFNRRLHQVPEALWQAVFTLLAEVHKEASQTQEYAVDSLPVAVCDNYRICRSHLYPRRRHGEAFRGFIASKKRYFYGLRVHLVMTTSGLPVEVMLAPGAEADISAFRRLQVDLPAGAHLFADAAYLDQHEEALLADAGLHLVVPRRKNSKSPLPPWVNYIAKQERKRIETVFSQIVSAFGRKVHAVTPRGFELKTFLTVLAYTLNATL